MRPGVKVPAKTVRTGSGVSSFWTEEDFAYLEKKCMHQNYSLFTS